MPEIPALAWHKSRYSQSGGNCVEVAVLDDGRRAVRDSKNPHGGGTLIFTSAEWAAFTAGVRYGEFS